MDCGAERESDNRGGVRVVRGGVAGSGGHLDSAEALQVERVTPRVEHVGVERLDALVGSDVVADGGALLQRPAAVVLVDVRHHKDAHHSCGRQKRNKNLYFDQSL